MSKSLFFQDLVFLGTASCYPTVSRAVSCMALRFTNGSSWLFDAGEGTQIQVQKSVLKPNSVKKIFVTHLHGDHTFGLPGLMCLIAQSSQQSSSSSSSSQALDNTQHIQKVGDTEAPKTINNSDNSEEVEQNHIQLEIYGPVGLRNYIRTALRLTYSTAVPSYVVHELHDVPYIHNQPHPLLPSTKDCE